MTSTTVMTTPAGSGMCISTFRAIAVPMTSATSVAMIAHSAKNQMARFNHLGRNSRHALDRSNPVTEPSLIQRDCKKMAIKLESKMMNRRLN